MSYRDDAKTAVPTPWYENHSTQGLTGEIGGLHDEAIDLDKAAVKMRWTAGARMAAVSSEVGARVIPMAGDVERLRRIGAGYALPRYDGESEAQYQARLDEAFPAYELMATAAGIVKEIRAFGVVDVEIAEEWMATGIEGKPYEFKIAIWLGPDFGALGWGPMQLPFTLGETLLGLAGATEAQVTELVRIVLRWKAASSLPVSIFFRFGNAAVIDSELYPLTLPFTIDGELDGVEERPLVGSLLDITTTLPFELWGNYLIKLPS